MKVLVAEHEMMCQSFLCNALSVRGLQPVLAVNGERAWSILQEKDAPRLAIIDFRLPVINGIDICKQLRARHDTFYTYLLLLVPNSYRLDHLLALESGADDCLAKPFNQDELGARLAIAGRILNIDDRLTEINGRWRTMLDTLPFGVADGRTRPSETDEHYVRATDGIHSPHAIAGTFARPVAAKADRHTWSARPDQLGRTI